MRAKLTKLQDVIHEISMGPFGSDIKIDNFKESGVPVLNGANLMGIKLVEDSFKYVTDAKAKSLKKANASRGDIVVTHRGTLGQISYIPESSKYDNYIISQSQFRVRFKDDEVDPAYITYFFHSSEGQKRLLANKSYVGVPALAQATTNFRQIEVPLPNKSEQCKISAALSSFDAKIELNQKINTQLEAMAKSLYDYWFVQFDFPNAEGKPYKSSGGKMVYDEVLKREIPEGWEVKPLAKITSLLVRGISPKYVEENGITVLNQKCIRNKAIDFSLSRRHDNDLKNVGLKRIQVGDILVNSTGVGTLGRVAIVKYLEEPMTTTDSHVSILRVDKNKANQYFIGYSLTEKQPEIEHLGEGSTGQTELTRENLGRLKVILPPQELQDKFADVLKPFLLKMANNEKENKTLTQLRDWLLPMLMNGQVKVKTTYNTIVEPALSIAAEPSPSYQRSSGLAIPENKKAFARQVLAGKIVSTFQQDPHFTHIKFQKIQFLAEHLVEADLDLNYYYQAAGPYDNRFMHSIFDKFQKSKWFVEQGRQFVPLEKQEQIERYYQGFFAPVLDRLEHLFASLANLSEAESEIVATLYAIWNNRLILQQVFSEDLLIEDFFKWSERKQRYDLAEVQQGLQFLHQHKMIPIGFGRELKKAKDKR